MGVITNVDRIRSLVSNGKNWSWDVYPQMTIEREEAQALQDLEALKEYIKEKEQYADRANV